MNKPVTNYDHKTIQMRRGSTSEWRRYGTMCIPAEGEMCVEFFQGANGKRTGKLGIKVGNGASSYSELQFLITDTTMDGRISNEDIARWNEAYQWGNHASVGYITEELDPVFTKSPAGTITNADIAKWNEASADGGGMTDEERAKLNEAHGWGNHADAGYINPNDTIFGGSYQN